MSGERRIISILVDNEFGTLARIVGLFSARGYNIESLSVAIVDNDRNLSKINIVTSGEQRTIDLITKLLERIVPVYKAIDISTGADTIERSLCLCKVVCIGDKRLEALRISETFRANIVDATDKSFVFEVFGKHDKIEAFISLMKPLGLLEVSKTGVVAMLRGDKSVF